MRPSRIVQYSGPAGLARDAHEIGCGDRDALGWLVHHGADLEAARAAAREEGRIDVAVVLELLAGADHRELGRGVRRLAFELRSRYEVTLALVHAADAAHRLTTERRPEARGAYAFEAGDALRAELLARFGPVMTRAQVPDLLDRIRWLGAAPDAIDLFRPTTFEPEVE